MLPNKTQEYLLSSKFALKKKKGKFTLLNFIESI